MENAQIGSEQKAPQVAGGLRFMKSQSQSKLIKDKQIIAAAPPVMCGESEHSLRISQLDSQGEGAGKNLESNRRNTGNNPIMVIL